MPNAREDIAAVEAAADLLVRGLNSGDISSLADIITDATIVLPPARRTIRGQQAIEFFRTMATSVAGVRLLSTDLDRVAEGIMRDVGTLSLRPKQREERNFFRYMMLWQQVGSEWKLVTMTWNRDAPAPGAKGKGEASGGAQGEM